MGWCDGCYCWAFIICITAWLVCAVTALECCAARARALSQAACKPSHLHLHPQRPLPHSQMADNDKAGEVVFDRFLKFLNTVGRRT